jgi:hypothetical protein
VFGSPFYRRLKCAWKSLLKGDIVPRRLFHERPFMFDNKNDNICLFFEYCLVFIVKEEAQQGWRGGMGGPAEEQEGDIPTCIKAGPPIPPPPNKESLLWHKCQIGGDPLDLFSKD